MASTRVGTGRGRGFKSKQQETKPGDEYSIFQQERLSPMDHLELMIKKMSMDFEDLETDPMLQEFRNAVHTKEELMKAVGVLVSQCLEDHTFIPSAVRLCCSLNDFVVDESKFRTTFLLAFRSAYQQRDDLRKERPPTKWIGCITLLAEAICNFRLEGNLPMQGLIDSFLDDIQLCLQDPASDEEVDCAAVQLLYIGEVVCQYGDAGKVKAVKTAISEAIVGARGSENARRQLVEAYEKWVSNWTSKQKPAGSTDH